MKSMNVEILPIAREDVNQAMIYIAIDNPTAADALLDCIEKQLEQVAAFPFCGAEVLFGKRYPRRYYRLPVPPYNIYYRVYEDRIVVMRVLHERMDAGRIL